METTDAARIWVEAWTHGWRTHDPDVIADRYAVNGVFLSHPFREPGRGHEAARSYAAGVFEQEDFAIVSFRDAIVQEDRAAVEYEATITSVDGKIYRLAGVSLLRFEPDGLVTEHYDYWAMAEHESG
jgi:hypothetical protein